jgi:hypothetical protein
MILKQVGNESKVIISIATAQISSMTAFRSCGTCLATGA